MFAKLPPAAHPCPILGKHPFHPRAHRGPRVAPPASPPHPAKSAAPPPVSRRASAGRRTGQRRSRPFPPPRRPRGGVRPHRRRRARPCAARPRKPTTPAPPAPPTSTPSARSSSHPPDDPFRVAPPPTLGSPLQPALARPGFPTHDASALLRLGACPRRGMGTGAVFWSRSMPEGVRRAIPWLGERTARGRPAGDAASPSFQLRASVNQPFLPARSPAGR